MRSTLMITVLGGFLGVSAAATAIALAEPVGQSAVPSAASASSPSLSLQDAIKRGLANHPFIERAEYAAQIAKALTKQTRGERYPWLEASVAESNGSLRIVTSDGRTIHDRGGHGFDPGGALPHHNQNMLTGGLILNQLITDFGYTAHRILAQEASAAASEKEMLTNRAMVIFNVQKAYLGCLLQERLLTIAEETVSRRRAVRDQAQALYKQQLRAKLDLDLLNVELSNAELAVIDARNKLRQSFAALNNAMGVPGSPRYDLEKGTIAVAPPSTLESLVTHGLQNRPELLEGRHKLQASEELLTAVRSLHYGSVSGVGVLAVSKFWDVHDGGLHNNEVAPFWGLGATGRLPLFAGFKIQQQVREAEALKGEAEEDLRDIANDVVMQVIRAYLAVTSNAEQVGLEEERVKVAREALQLAQDRYRLGLSSIIDVIQATTMLYEAEARLAESQALYRISQSAVAYAAGQDYRRY